MFDDPSCCTMQPIDEGRFDPIIFGAHCNRNQSSNLNTGFSNPPRSRTEEFGPTCRVYTSSEGRTSSTCGLQSAQVAVQPVEAIQAISRMRGGAQSQLMLGNDHNLWVVKFKNNPQHLKILANELIATQMAEAIGLSVPSSGVIEVSEWLIENSSQLYIDQGYKGRQMCSSGLQFGSQFVGGLMPRQVIDYLPDEQLRSVRNLEQFAGILAFDKWTGNSDGRQVVFRRTAKERDYRAVFVDQGFCFNAGEWTFPGSPLCGVFARNSVYSAVSGWNSFEPWLTHIEQFSAETLWNIAETVPSEWYENDTFQLEELVDTLLRRRSQVRELITQFKQSSRSPFPGWKNYVRTRENLVPRLRRKPRTRVTGDTDWRLNPPLSAKLESWLIQHAL